MFLLCSNELFKPFKLLFNHGDLQLLPAVDHLPHLEVPYPNTNGGQHFRRASGSCPSIPLHKYTLVLSTMLFLPQKFLLFSTFLAFRHGQHLKGRF